MLNMARFLGILLLVLMELSLPARGVNHPRCLYSGRQYPHYGYGHGRYYLWGQPVSPACRGHLPCYDITLNYIVDGPGQSSEVPVENGTHFRHFTSYGLNRQQVINQGRRAAAYFCQLYGVDFTSLPDEAFLSGRRINNEGVEFRPYVWESNGRNRLYTASTKRDAQLFNRPIQEAGWLVRFTRPFQSKGTFTKLIPASAGNFFGSHVIFPCGPPSSNNYYYRTPCRNILNPHNPRAPIVIYFRKAEYLGLFTDPSPFVNFDTIVEHSVWGVGRERGIAISRPNSDASDGRMTLTFPSFL